MPDPVAQPIASDPSNKTWLYDMQSYFAPNKDYGRRKQETMPDRKSAAYSMGDVDDESIKRILIALFGGDASAADMYLRGEDPSGRIRYGGAPLPPIQGGVNEIKSGRGERIEDEYIGLVGY